MKIVAGKFGGLNITPVPGRGTRPTSAKVRESMFNMLMPYITSETVALDLFAGTGALGIEAVSRGSKTAILVDKASKAIKVIKTNVTKTHDESAFDIFHMPAKAALNYFDKQKIKFDLVMLDPPYADHINDRIALNMANKGLINPKALFLIETDYPLDNVPSGSFKVISSKKYGLTYVEIWRYEGK